MAKLNLSQRQEQRLAIFGRMRMAEWIEMPEREFAREIETIEKEELFRKLRFGAGARPGAIRRQPWPQGRLVSMAELNEHITPGGGERVKVEERLEERSALMALIQKMGRESFERYYLYGTEAASLAEIAKRTGVTEAEARAVNDFLVELGAEAEFSTLPKAAGGKSNYCVARVAIEGGQPVFEFFSPHWARGLYQVRYDLIEEMKSARELSPLEVKALPGLLKRLETVNLRQSTMFRILETLTKVQSDYLKTRKEDQKKAISLRMLAQRLDLAPSTISRALAERSLKLPWDKEVPMIELLPGRRRQLRLILSRWLAEDATPTDAAFVARLKSDYGIAISRRTVNAVRHEFLNPSDNAPRTPAARRR